MALTEQIGGNADIVFPEPEITREKAMQAFISLRAQAEKDFPQGMSLDEINDEICKIRESISTE